MLKSVSCTITRALENSKQNPQTIKMKSTHRSITQTSFYNVGWTWKQLINVKKNDAGKTAWCDKWSWWEHSPFGIFLGGKVACSENSSNWKRLGGKWIGEKLFKQENGSMVTHPGRKWLHGITGDGLTARYENEIEVMRRIWLLISHDVLIYMYIYYSNSSLTQLEVSNVSG